MFSHHSAIFFFNLIRLGITNTILHFLQNFYMIGRSKNRSTWRVLKIDRSEPTELNITEDPTTYTELECCELLKRIHDGNKSTGGLRFVCTCYGIVGMLYADIS